MRLTGAGIMLATAASGVLLVIATLLVLPRTAAPPSAAGIAALPALTARANDVSELRMRRGDEAVTLLRFGDRWVVAEKGGFPADLDIVRAVVAGLASLTLEEERTDDPARHARIEVEDPALVGARSRLIEARTVDGTVVGQLIIGRRAVAPIAPGREALYVRRPGDTRAWLADGRLPLPDEALGWIDRRLADFGPEQMREIRVRDRDAQPTAFARAAPQGPVFQLVGDSLGAHLSPSAAQRLSRLLSQLSFEDVRPAGEIPFGGGRIVDLITFQGLRVRIESASGEVGRTWVRIQAALAPGGDGRLPAAAVGAMAAALSERTDGWAFRLAPWVHQTLHLPSGELVTADPS